MSTFERYLTLWVALCIVAGIALGHVMPGVFYAIGAAEIAKEKELQGRGGLEPVRYEDWEVKGLASDF